MIALPNGDLCVADRLYSRLQVVSRDGEHVEPCRVRGRTARLAPAMHHTVRGTYGTDGLAPAPAAGPLTLTLQVLSQRLALTLTLTLILTLTTDPDH